MDWLREYWWVLVILATLVLLAVVLLRPRQRVSLTDSAPVRPHMAPPAPAEGRGLTGEHAAAASDIAGDVLRAPVHRELDAMGRTGDDLCRLKGVGPKFEVALNALGFERFEQIAALSPTEIERLDQQLGPFAGRLTRDRVVEQAAYLARNDIDGFEQRFGKLTN
jgi:predicted flap endonuclease-1-like 5' DNA nuclease